jgi:hypothetical protein
VTSRGCFALEQISDDRGELERAERLRQETIRARSLDCLPIALLSARRQHHDRHALECGIGSNMLEHVDPAAARHHQVEEDQVGRVPANELERLIAIGGFDERVPRGLEGYANEAA